MTEPIARDNVLLKYQARRDWLRRHWLAGAATGAGANTIYGVNLSLADSGGELLLVPQFTLAADTSLEVRDTKPCK